MTRKPWGPPPWSWPGVTALVLAASLGLGWGATLIMSALPTTPPVSEKGLELLNGIGQVLAGAVATFIGASIATQRDDRLGGPTRPVDASDPHPGGVTPPNPGSDDDMGGTFSETHR